MAEQEMKVAKKQAEMEFESWAEAWDIETDVSDFDEDDLEQFQNLKKKIIRALQQGRACFIEDYSKIQFNLRFPRENLSQIVLEMPEGDALTSTDKYKPHEQMKKQSAFIARMAGQPPSVITKLKVADLKFLQAVTALFLAS